MTEQKEAPRRHGFAALTPEQRRELGRRGGKRSHELGRGHRFDSESASAAGKIPHQRGTAYRPKRGPRKSELGAAQPAEQSQDSTANAGADDARNELRRESLPPDAA